MPDREEECRRLREALDRLLEEYKEEPEALLEFVPVVRVIVRRMRRLRCPRGAQRARSART